MKMIHVKIFLQHKNNLILRNKQEIPVSRSKKEGLMKYLKMLMMSLLFFPFSTFIFAQNPNQALHFDGVDDYVSFTDGVSLNGVGFTIDFWAKKDIGQGYGYVLSKGNSLALNQYMHIGWDTPTLFRCGFFANDLTVTVADDGAWHHWAITYDPSVTGQDNRFIYRDGQVIASDESSAFIGTVDFELGRAGLLGGNPSFRGILDRVHIESIVKTQAQIQEYMFCEAISIPQPFIHWYNFNDDNTGTTLDNDAFQLTTYDGQLNNFALSGATSNWTYDSPYEVSYFSAPMLDQTLSIGANLTLDPNFIGGDCDLLTNTFSWYRNGVLIPGQSTETLIIENVTGTDAGTYDVKSYDGAILIESEEVEVTVELLTTTNLVSDYFIDVSWDLPVDSCLLDPSNQPYTVVTVQLLRDGDQVDYQTYEGDALQAIYDANASVTGTYRDFVGMDQSHTYSIIVFVGPFGNIDPDCSYITAVGSTTLEKAPDSFSVTTDDLSKINISWINRSDLATSYQLFRDGNLIATISDDVDRDSVIAYEDAYLFGNSGSINSGQEYTYSIEMVSSYINQSWPYSLGQGNTLDVGFTTSTQFTNRVETNWLNNAASLIDGYQIYRDNNLFAVKNINEVSFIDAAPHFGDSINYQLRLLKDDTVRAAFNGKGFALANGMISGRVVTEEGSFPVQNVAVSITRKSNGAIFNTVSSASGVFSFTELPYGLLDSFELNAVLDEHTFSYPIPSIGLSANNPSTNNVFVLDNFTYEESPSQDNIFMQLQEMEDADHVVIDWLYFTQSPEVYIDLVRNGEIIYAETGGDFGSGMNFTYSDLGGTPNEETTYRVRMYSINGNTVSEADTSATLIFPAIARIPDGSFNVAAETINAQNTGNISLSWTHTSTNIDAFRIYRNGDLVAELSPFTFDYTDKEAPFGTDLFYTITAVRNVDQVTYETKVPTASSPSSINLGTLPAPFNVNAIPNNSVPYIFLTWDSPIAGNPDFNFTGYYIYRDGELIGSVPKEHARLYNDFFAFGKTNALYEVSLYRETENIVFESTRAAASPVDHPTLDDSQNLTATANQSEFKVELSWDNANSTSNFDGYQLFYRNTFDVNAPPTSIGKVSPYMNSFVHYPSDGPSLTYFLYRYKTVDTVDHLSTVFSEQTVSFNLSSGNVYPPQNVMASRNLPNHVKICWEYLDFIESSFEIYRDGVLLDSVPVGARSYYDYSADPVDHSIGYQVRAKQSGMTSGFIGATGDIIDPKMIYGSVLDATTRQGVFNVPILAIIGPANKIQTQTDSSGYFSFMLPNDLSGQSVTINAFYNSAPNTQNITLTEEDRYELELLINTPGANPSSLQAEIIFAGIDVDTFDLSGNVHWQPSNENYDGVEVRRGIDVIGDVSKDDGNLFIDTNAVPGIQYTYQFRAYTLTENGKAFTDFFAKEVAYPALAPPINLSGTLLNDQNAVLLQWSHLYDHADGYRITRNNEFISEVMKDTPFAFLDTTGTAGEQYTYTITAYKVVDGQLYFSSDEEVTIIYPAAAGVSHLVLSAPFIPNFDLGGGVLKPEYYLNHVLISWEYNAVNGAGFKLYRDDELIATLPVDSTSYKDYEGIPGTVHEYSVVALISQNSTRSESEKSSGTIQFPDIETPYLGTAMPRPELGDVELRWKYMSPGIDGFYIYNVTNASFIDTITAGLSLDGSEFNGFIDRSSFPGSIGYVIIPYSYRNGVPYQSATSLFLGTIYPQPPTPTCNATQGAYENAVEITWDYPVDANVDGFLVQRKIVGSPVEFETLDTLGPGSRKYIDLFNIGESAEQYTYQIIPIRSLNGTIIWLGQGCSPDGFPGSSIPPGNSITGSNNSRLGHAVAVDGEWKVVGAPNEGVGGVVRTYKFENKTWVEKQTFIGDPGAQFGYSLDMDDKLFIAGSIGLNGNTGAVNIYRLDNDEWVYDNFIPGSVPGGKFGNSVAIDEERMVVGGVISGSPGPDNFRKSIQVYERPSSCNYSTICPNYTTIPVASDTLTEMALWSLSGSIVVDIDGDDIIMGAGFSTTSDNVQGVGVAAHYKIEGSSVRIKEIIWDEASYNDQVDLEYFGHDVAINNGKMAITSRTGRTSSGERVGKVKLFAFDQGQWNNFQTLFSEAPQPFNGFGNGIDMNEGILAVSEPFIGDQNLSSRLFLYKEDDFSGQFELIQSPDPSSNNYRSEFYDSGNPDIYPTDFGFAVDLSNNHIAVGAPNVNGATSKAYCFDLFDVKVGNLSASDGTFTNTKVSWILEGCEGCPDDYIDSFRIYRDAELIGIADGNATSFFDNDTDLVPGASLAISGKEYIYEVEAKINASFEYTSPKSADTGFSKRKGKLSGKVLVIGTNSGVPGVEVKASGIDPDDNSLKEYSTSTLSDGSFVLNDIYVGNGITYELEPSFEDHVFLPPPPPEENSFLLTPNAFDKSNIFFFDTTAYVINGTVKREGAFCNLENVSIRYYQSINGVETLVDTTLTDDAGNYSIVVNPNQSNLSEIRIALEDVQTYMAEQGDTSLIQYSFSPNEVTYTSFDNFPIITEQNFVDTLTYPVQIEVVNPCGSPIADQPIEIRVGTLDGCYEFTVETDTNGEVTVDLSPNNYFFVVQNIVGAGVDNYENAGINFLKLRPATLDLEALHLQAGGDTLPAIDPIRYVYHRAVVFENSNTFDRFLCDDPIPIIKQGEQHAIEFNLFENHRTGETCAIEEGCIVVRNSGADNPIDTLTFQQGAFSPYQFTAGVPNLVAPHTWVISAQYFSEQGGLLGSVSIPIIVEGQRSLPGTGVTTEALTDQAGDIQLPLMVLRDPPGDRSFSSIQAGSSFTNSLSIGSSDSFSAGLKAETKFAVSGGGLFIDADVGVGGGSGNNYNANFTINTTDTYSTSSSPSAVGREANVIVGTGMSSLYGLNQILEIDENCDAVTSTVVSEGISGFSSTYGYTVAFIENLIAGYRSDSIEVEIDELNILRLDGSLYTKEEALARFGALIETWEGMLHYHDVETVPHYVLCSDFSYRNNLNENAIALYDDWRNGFCGQIGSYEGDQFVMDDEIIWTPALINAYNNAVAFTDTIKGLPLSFVEDGDLELETYEIDQNNLSVTDQFHNTLGNSAKSAEVFDISGNVTFTRSFSTQQSSSTSTSFSRYFYLDASLGGYTSNDNLVGFGLLTLFTEIEAKVGVRLKSDAKISVSRSQAQTNSTNITYTILDDDAEDQVAFIALQAPLQNQTPFFIRLGGLSSCPPEEALTTNQDNDPLLIDRPDINVVEGGGSTPNPSPMHGVDPESAAIFQVKIDNLSGATGLTRNVEVFLEPGSNPMGAVIKLGGSNLNITSPVFSIPAGGSLTQTLTIERPNGTQFYNFTGLRIGVQPVCGGLKEYIELDVYFQSPCSSVSLTKPFDGLVVNRISPNDTTREVIPFELRDYQSGNENLQHIQLEYKRLGTGSDWKPVPGGFILREALVLNDAGLAFGEPKMYFYEWDITGQDNLYPDGDYSVRASAFCGVNGGVQLSNEINITLARSPLLITGFPEPADGLWTPGDVISTTYSTDIDCGILNTTDSIQNYVQLIDLSTMSFVPFNAVCQNNSLTLIPTVPMSDYDGSTLRATYTDIKNIVGNSAPNVIWDFDVVTQDVDWLESTIEVTIFENEMKTISTSLNNINGLTVNGLTLSGSQPWYTYDPAGTFSVPSNGRIVNLTFDGSNGVGSDTTTLQVNGLTGRTPTLVVILNVIEEVPLPPISSVYTDSMELILNWRFVGGIDSLSKDIQDVIQVYKGGLLRGYAYIEEQGNYYFARVNVKGNASDEDGLLDFVIWNADESQAYTPIASTTIPFEANTVRGVLTNPEILLVEDDTYEFRQRIYVDSSNFVDFPDGKTWATAFNDLQDALAIANTADTIWMANGIYYPSVGDQSVSYEMNEGIAIHGGFQTGMTSLGQRTGNDETILSGNIGLKVDSTDNSFHVVKASAIDLLLDQLSIVEGTANGAGDNSRGGCLWNTGSVTLLNCAMANGSATGSGAMILNDGELTIDGGIYSVPSGSQVSNLHNEPGSQLTIKTSVEIKEE